MAMAKRTKTINRSRILREIWINQEISRIDIARNLHLDKSTISHNIHELLELGVVDEVSEGDSGPQGGRRPVIIKFNKHFGCVLGIELRSDSFTAVAVDLEGKIIYSSFEKASIRGASLKEDFTGILNFLIKEIEQRKINILGIGVGLSGIINARDGIIKYSIPLEIVHDYAFYDKITSNFDIPIFIDNDANACVWGELAFHRQKDLKDFLFLLLEIHDIDPRKKHLCDRISVGIGLVINGNVHYGRDFSAGEFRSLLRNDTSIGQFSLNAEEQNSIESDENIQMRFFHELGAHVGLLVNTFDLTHVILGGYFEHYDGEVLKIFEEEIKKNWAYSDLYKIKKHIWFSSFGDQAVAYGAGGMVLNKLFTDFELMEEVSSLQNILDRFGVYT